MTTFALVEPVQKDAWYEPASIDRFLKKNIVV